MSRSSRPLPLFVLKERSMPATMMRRWLIGECRCSERHGPFDIVVSPSTPFARPPRVGSVAEQWAADYNMGKSARFDMSLYGSSVANDLAQGYFHRCQYFFDIWLCSGDERYTYSQHDLDAYVEPCIVSELQDILQGRALARLRWLQSLVPRCKT